MTRSKTPYLLTSAALGMAWVAQTAAATEFTIDPAHSSVTFKIKNRDITFVYGRFNEIAGTINTDKPQNPTTVELKAEIEAKSIDTNNKERDTHLKGADFIDVKKNPKITFEGKSTQETKDGKFEVKGELNLHGVKKEITVIVEQTGGKRIGAAFRLGLHCTFTIKRSDFGMDQMLPDIADDVTVMVSLEGEYKLPPTG